MHRFWQTLKLYRGFILAGILALIVIGLFLSDTNSGRSAKSKQDAKSIKFLSLAWQVEAITAIRKMVAQWNDEHPEQPVELIQGTWSSVHDFLITGFETGDIPDIFHYESAIIVDFALRDYLADLAPYIQDELKQDVLDVAWSSVTRSDGQVIGIPFLAESFIVLYNKKLFAEAGISAPSFEKPWSWSDLQLAARRLTLDINADGVTDRWGVAIGLRSGANLIMNHSIAFGGSYFYTDENGLIDVQVGEPEKELLGDILTMLYTDKSMAPASLGQTSSALIPGFLAGRYAMLVGAGAWARQQVVENAEESFEWGVMPPLRARTQKTGLNTQTFSISKSSAKLIPAIQFINYLVEKDNMAQMAASDWLLPTRRSCLEMPRFNTREDGWDVVSQSAKYLSTGPWVGMAGYNEWKSRVANPTFQLLFSDRITLDDAARRIELESNSMLHRYQMRGDKW
ncbi:MAG: extracellular solute-binding protein [Candidatus Neomarinimicrobiota bacterium]